MPYDYQYKQMKTCLELVCSGQVFLLFSPKKTQEERTRATYEFKLKTIRKYIDVVSEYFGVIPAEEGDLISYYSRLAMSAG